MYLNSIQLTNIRAIKKCNLDLSPEPGWNVIIGENGSGKSTLVRAIALCLAGPREAPALRQTWSDWLSPNSKTGRIRIDVLQDKNTDKRTGKGTSVKKFYIPAVLEFRDDASEVVGTRQRSVSLKARKIEIDASNYLWGQGGGWFAASYGPYRRFTGGNKNYEKLFYSNPKLARHLSVFGEDIALSEALDWLKELHVLALEGRIASTTVNSITSFVNESGLLPHNTKLVEIMSDAVYFKDGNGVSVPVDQLSDGFRSILSMAFDLIRSLVQCYGAPKVFEAMTESDPKINVPGVVVIDEIDAHLHPTWQSRIGSWLTKHFPKIQFIVTSHSPIVCQAAARGTIWKLPAPGTDASAERIVGRELDRLLYGSILDAYDTSLFGQKITRSEEGVRRQRRIAELNIKSLSQDLSPEDARELEDLRASFPIDAGKGLEQC